jgi:hypothetical protein
MSKVKIQGHASGTGVLTVTAPNTSTDRTITLPDATGTLATTADSVGGANGVDFNDNVKARFGTGNDLEIYHDGSNSYISDAGTGILVIRSDTSFQIQAANGEAYFNAVKDAETALYHNDVRKFETTATGVAVTGGIAIGGTGASNTLDDYEEGTWTPACSRATITTINKANYTKIGRLVHVFAYLVLAADGTGHNISFTGLPFTTQAEVHETGITQFSNNSVSRGILARTSGNSTTIDLIYTDGTQAQVPADTVDGGHVMISLTYNVA